MYIVYVPSTSFQFTTCSTKIVGLPRWLLLLLLLSHFSCVWLCATPEMTAHQAPPSLGFSRREHWSGLPFPSQCMKVKRESEVTQSCPTPSDPMDCSLPGSSIHGIFQARVLEWGALAFFSQVALVVKQTNKQKKPSVNAGDLRDVGSIPGWEDPLEEGMATHSSNFAWRIP